MLLFYMRWAMSESLPLDEIGMWHGQPDIYIKK